MAIFLVTGDIWNIIKGLMIQNDHSTKNFMAMKAKKTCIGGSLFSTLFL